MGLNLITWCTKHILCERVAKIMSMSGLPQSNATAGVPPTSATQQQQHSRPSFCPNRGACSVRKQDENRLSKLRCWMQRKQTPTISTKFVKAENPVQRQQWCHSGLSRRYFHKHSVQNDTRQSLAYLRTKNTVKSARGCVLVAQKKDTQILPWSAQLVLIGGGASAAIL